MIYTTGCIHKRCYLAFTQSLAFMVRVNGGNMGKDMDRSYNIPTHIELKFHPEQIEGLSDRMFRIVWCAISIGHIRDQYFSLHTYEFIDKLKKIWPLRPAEFISYVQHSELNRFGKIRGQYSSIDVTWWLKIWKLLYYDGDIELRSEVDH